MKTDPPPLKNSTVVAFMPQKRLYNEFCRVIALVGRSRCPVTSPQTGGAGGGFACGGGVTWLEARCQDDCGINATYAAQCSSSILVSVKLLPERLANHVDDERIMRNPVNNGSGQHRVDENGFPFVEREISRDNGALALGSE